MRMTRENAKTLAQEFGFRLDCDFHALTSSEVGGVIDAANDWRYHKPTNASGSRARCFYQYIQRTLSGNGAK